MSTDWDDDMDAGPDEDCHGPVIAAQWAVNAGLLVVVDGEILITDKGLAVMREQMEADGTIPKRH